MERSWPEQTLRLFLELLIEASWKEWIEPLNEVLNKIQADGNRRDSRQSFFDSCKLAKALYTNLQLLKIHGTHSSLPYRPYHESTSFNSKKSDLKFVESAGCALATIASPTVYASTINHEKTGIICNKPTNTFILEDWVTTHTKPKRLPWQHDNGVIISTSACSKPKKNSLVPIPMGATIRARELLKRVPELRD